ncbi:hypothetical protein B0T17DRAFT_613333 [Bombardia bombarda]|uniref:Xylanolytic transcriptional activator regulatory domain-containing protein n=1 Tax=Bombardia bombarda TaxID=252184 RepID=A0AA39XN30_9PEZI|nr:hypothetical protein B0T17DRAFT_613333 [Bombardia bombarda]
MASNTVDADAYTAPFMLTKSMKRDVYFDVDPTKNHELQADGKVVLIIGATGGIGFAIAKAWSTAGAKGIILVGRTEETLQKAVQDLDSKTSKVLAIKADISSSTEVDDLFKKATAEFSHIDVVINASASAAVGAIGTVDPAAWWSGFETNVKGFYNVVHAFINTNGAKGTIVNLVSLMASMLVPGMSGNIVSKLALIKLAESIDVEHPDLRVFSVHPGLVEPEGGRGVILDAFKGFAKDKAALTAGLTLWLATPRADFLKGGYLHSNWHVEELEKHKDEIVEKKLVKLGFLNGQLQLGGYNCSDQAPRLDIAHDVTNGLSPADISARQLADHSLRLNDLLDRVNDLNEKFTTHVEKGLKGSMVTASIISNADSVTTSGSTPYQSSSDEAQQPSSQLRHELQLQNVGSDVAFLQRLSAGQKSHNDILFSDSVVFNTCPILECPSAPAYMLKDPDKPIRCIWLPAYDEAKVLFEQYKNTVSFLQHVVHRPSLCEVLDHVYLGIDGNAPIKAGHLVLLLSIVAITTYAWTEDGTSLAIFSNVAQAKGQTPFWIETTLDVIDYAQRSSCVSLELIQGIIIFSFLVSNDGISLRYRSLISTALSISRELGLHRSDHPNNDPTEGATVKAEIGRRVWWNLVATDWFMAARYSGPTEGIYQCNPRHMMVKKPLNIDDDNLHDGSTGLPQSQPTETSYFLQRIRLAELSRYIADRQLLVEMGPGKQSYADIMDVDADLQAFMSEIPPFLNINDDSSDTPGSLGIIIQAYLLNNLVLTQRCKLHLPYLEHMGPYTTPYSRTICVQSARRIVKNELRLEKEAHPFVQTRLKFPGILYGVFMASIVLMMDFIAKGRANSGDSNTHHDDVFDVFSILEDAKYQSSAAAEFLESLVRILRKYKVAALPSDQPNSQSESTRSDMVAQEKSRASGVASELSLDDLYPLPEDLNKAAGEADDSGDGFLVGLGEPDAVGNSNELDASVNESEDIPPLFMNELSKELDSFAQVQWNEFFTEIDSFFF